MQKKHNGNYAKGKWPIEIKGMVKGERVFVTLHVTNKAGGFDGTLELLVDEHDPKLLRGIMTTTVAEQRGPAMVRIE